MENRKYQGYTFLKNGMVYGKRHRPLKLSKVKNHYEFKFNGKKVIFHRVFYKAFNPNFNIEDRNLCVVPKDGNYFNIDIDNFVVVPRENVACNQKLTNEQVKEIRALYTGKAQKNQHYPKQGYSYNDLAKMYNVSKSSIAMIIRGETRNYV